MNAGIRIERSTILPANFEIELLPAAAREEFGALERLRNDWQTGRNQFTDNGEAFYVARIRGRLVGVCGLNRDPFVKDEAVGRLRRLYVLPEFRRRGVGHSLVARAIDDGLNYFRTFHVRTYDAQAGAFYLAIGFTALVGQEGFTHRLSYE